MDLTSDFADSVPDPALTHQWLVRFPNSTNAYSSIPEEMNVSFTKIPAKPRHNAGTNTYFPDFYDISAISVTFYETKDFDCTKWIRDWRKKIVNHSDGVYGVSDEYKVDATLELYSIDSETPVLTITLKGVWPTEQNDWQLSYDDAEGRIKCIVPFSVDDAEIE